MKPEIDMLLNRLNHDPVIFKGCSLPECLMVAGVSLGVSCITLSIVGQLLLGNFVYGVALGFLVGGALIYAICTFLQK